MQNITCQEMIVTPEMARKWLAKNKDNRLLKARLVNILASEITSGHWIVDGNAIKFNGDGTLIDGQHRLQAIVKADSPVPTMVIQGLAKDAKYVLDTGAKRTFSDVLSMRHEQNYRNVAAGLAMYAAYMRGDASLKSQYLSHQTGIELLEQHPEIRESARVAQAAWYKFKLLRPAAITCFHYVFGRIDPALNDLFWERLVAGTGLEAGDPILLLRARLVDNASSKAKLPDLEIAALIVKAWNLSRQGKKARFLRWNTGIGESFPVAS